MLCFPQSGGMFCGASEIKIFTEEDYYLSEWNSKEQEKGLHQSTLKLVNNSTSEGGRATLQPWQLMRIHLLMSKLFIAAKNAQICCVYNKRN